MAKVFRRSQAQACPESTTSEGRVLDPGQLYKARDRRLAKAVGRLQWISDNHPQDRRFAQQITQIRLTLGLRDDVAHPPYPAIYAQEIFNEDVAMRMGNCYMHTETRGVLELHALALIKGT